MSEILEKLISADVDMLVVVDDEEKFKGVVFCDDFLNYIVDPKGEKLWCGEEAERRRRAILRRRHIQFLKQGPSRLRRTSAPEWTRRMRNGTARGRRCDDEDDHDGCPREMIINREPTSYRSTSSTSSSSSYTSSSSSPDSSVPSS